MHREMLALYSWELANCLTESGQVSCTLLLLSGAVHARIPANICVWQERKRERGGGQEKNKRKCSQKWKSPSQSSSNIPDFQAEKALKHYKKAVSLEPGVYRYQNRLAFNLVQSRRYDEGFEAFFACYTLRPEEADMINNLGNVFMAKGQVYITSSSPPLQGGIRNTFTPCCNALAHQSNLCPALL